ncbi:MAG: DUF6781 family protein [Rubrivivax sp.]
MAKPAFDTDALITMFETASATGSAKLRQTVGDATLQALQGRELSLRNIRAVLGTMTQAANNGLARNAAPAIDIDKMLDQAVAGMDDALLKAVDANRVALQQLAAQGADLREKHLQKALSDLEKMEDALIDSVQKSAGGASEQMAAAWGGVLDKLNAGGTLSGAKAASTAEQFAQQMKTMQGAMRDSRAASLRAAQVLAESYTAMVSGVLIGMSDAMRSPASAPAEAPTRAKGAKK